MSGGCCVFPADSGGEQGTLAGRGMWRGCKTWRYRWARSGTLGWGGGCLRCTRGGYRWVCDVMRQVGLTKIPCPKHLAVAVLTAGRSQNTYMKSFSLNFIPIWLGADIH